MKAVVMGRGSMSIGVVVVVVAVVAVYRNTEDSIGWIILLVCCTSYVVECWYAGCYTVLAGIRNKG